MADPTELDASALSQALAARRLSCRELMQATLARIERLNPTYNAIVSLRDGDALLAEADGRDAQLARGDRMGWMHGLPIAIKDLVATQGIRTTLGSPLLRDFVPQEDSTMVARIKAAGAIVIGKTNTPEFGLGSQTYNPLFGATRNAYDPTRTSGGSSGGAAVAVALHLLPVADGSDMMGSLRNPAGYNNIYALRPTWGRVPAGPAPEIYLGQLSTDGPMARTVADLAQLLAVQAGRAPTAPLSLGDDPQVFAAPLEAGARGLRIGWLGDLGGRLPFEDGVLDLCRRALGEFEALGHGVAEVLPAFDFDRLWDAWCTLRHWLVAGRQMELYRDERRRAQIKPEARWEIERGLALSALDIYEASKTRSAWYQTLRRLFETWDVLALPTAQVFPFDAATHWPAEIAGRRMDSYHRWMEVVVPGSMYGGPIMAVPAGFNAAGLPMGLQLIGRQRDELTLLRLAQAYDDATSWPRRRPPPAI